MNIFSNEWTLIWPFLKITNLLLDDNERFVSSPLNIRDGSFRTSLNLYVKGGQAKCFASRIRPKIVVIDFCVELVLKKKQNS